MTFKYLKGGVTPKQTFSFCHFRQLFYSIYVNILCKHDIYHLYFTFAYLGFVLILWHTFNIQIFVGKQKWQYQLRKIDFKKIQTNPNFPFRNYKWLGLIEWTQTKFILKNVCKLLSYKDFRQFPWMNESFCKMCWNHLRFLIIFHTVLDPSLTLWPITLYYKTM